MNHHICITNCLKCSWGWLGDDWKKLDSISFPLTSTIISLSLERMSCHMLWGNGTLDPGLYSYKCLSMCKYLDRKWLATKRSAGVTPRENLRNPLHAGGKACKQRDQSWLWNPDQMSSMTGASVGTQERLMTSKIFFKNGTLSLFLFSLHTERCSFSLSQSFNALLEDKN